MSITIRRQSATHTTFVCVCVFAVDLFVGGLVGDDPPVQPGKNFNVMQARGTRGCFLLKNISNVR